MWLSLWRVFVSPEVSDAKKTLMSPVASFFVGLSRFLALIFKIDFFLLFFLFRFFSFFFKKNCRSSSKLEKDYF